MGFDLHGNSDTDEGNYFRNSVWWWRPLWGFVSHHCSDILTEKDIYKGSFNDFYNISKSKALKIADRLFDLVEDGTVDAYAKENTLMIEKARAHNKIIDNERKALRQKVIEITGNKNIVPRDYPEPWNSQWNEITGRKDWNDNYPFDKGNVEAFIKFCNASDGFQIC